MTVITLFSACPNVAWQEANMLVAHQQYGEVIWIDGRILGLVKLYALMFGSNIRVSAELSLRTR